jgi:hypothetical protein
MVLLRLTWQPMAMVMTDCLVKETILFLQSHAIDLRHHLDTPILCNNDLHLMGYWTKQGDTASQLERLNIWWLYLQVVNLSKVVSGNSQTIIRHYYEGKKGQVTQYYHWPNQNRPAQRIGISGKNGYPF